MITAATKSFRVALIAVLCFAFGAFHLYTATFGLLSDLAQRAVHLTFLP